MGTVPQMYDDNPCKNISASLLLDSFERFSDRYGSEYPVVRNPQALIQGIDSVVHAMNEGHAPKNILLYILEDETDRENPYGARYILAITRVMDEEAGMPSFAIRLFYNDTQEMESISTVEPTEVIWSPDDLTTTHHETRTKYYLGFTYMLCDKSPGFDEEPMPDEALTLEEFLRYGMEGEIPTELMQISIDDVDVAEEAEKELSEDGFEADAEAATEVLDMFSGADGASAMQPTQAQAKAAEQAQEYAAQFEEELPDIFDNGAGFAEFVEDDSASKRTRDDGFDEEEFEKEISTLFDSDIMGDGQTDLIDVDADEVDMDMDEESQVPEEDDTEIVIISPEEYEEEYDDLEADYEELFE